MKKYQDHTGTITKKHRGFFGQYIITIDDGSKKIPIIVGKGIYDTSNIGQSFVVGHCGKKLINIRPYTFTKDWIIWNKFIDEIVPCNIKKLNSIQKCAVICFCYDTEMNSGGHSGFFDSLDNKISKKDIESALIEIGAAAFVPNFIESYTSGMDDDYIKTDDYFYKAKPSLTDIIEKYVTSKCGDIFSHP